MAKRYLRSKALRGLQLGILQSIWLYDSGSMARGNVAYIAETPVIDDNLKGSTVNGLLLGNEKFGRFSRCGGGLSKIGLVCGDLQAPIEVGPGSHGNAIKNEAIWQGFSPQIARGWKGLSTRMNNQRTAPMRATILPVLSAAIQPTFRARKGIRGPTRIPEMLPPVFISPQAGAV